MAGIILVQGKLNRESLGMTLHSSSGTSGEFTVRSDSISFRLPQLFKVPLPVQRRSSFPVMDHKPCDVVV